MDNQTEKTGAINILSKEDFNNVHSRKDLLEKTGRKGNRCFESYTDHRLRRRINKTSN